MARGSFSEPESCSVWKTYAIPFAASFVVALFGVLVVVGCFDECASSITPEPVPAQTTSRIKHIESVYPTEMATRISLISVDGVEYVCVYQGGIIRHMKIDTCRETYYSGWKVTETGVEEE